MFLVSFWTSSRKYAKKEVKISINWYQVNSEHSWNGKFQKKEKPLRQNVYSRVHFMGNERAFIAKITDI